MLFGCKKEEEKKLEKKTYDLTTNMSTNLVNQKDRETFKEMFKEYNLSNVDLFFSWLDNFNSSVNSECGIKDWTNTKELKYKDDECITSYEEKNNYSDGNCRLTSYALLQDLIKIDSVKETNGSYLMFDVDVLDNNNDYKVIKNRKNEFISLYDEIDVSNINLDKLKDAYIEKWKSLNVKISSDKVSLINVVMFDDYYKVLFIGHSGVLINLGDKYVFVEKIAFEEPYQINIINNVSDLKDIFKERTNYFTFEKDEIGPFVFENDKLIFEY